MIPLPDLAQGLALASSAGGGLAVAAGALALGLRHGIDWDHIAAITDITSSTAVVPDADEDWLVREPGLLLTDESHHATSGDPAPQSAPALAEARTAHGHAHEHGEHRHAAARPMVGRLQRRPMVLGLLYALGHGMVVIALGLLALLASSILPAWIDPIMGRVVGVTLLLLAAYLYYSVYRYFRGGEFRMRSRWMLLFGLVGDAWGWLLARARRHPYHRVAHRQQYGPGTAFGIGAIHGVGAETGTQVLLIAAAAGASSTAAGVAALFAFVLGLLISNSVVTVAGTVGFVSAGRRQWLYVGVGMLAATFSLVIGLMFLVGREGLLPALDPYMQWLGGPR